MRERLEKRINMIFFVLIIIAQIAVMAFYENSKQFYHIDELYTFEYAHNVMPVENNEGNFRIHKQESWYNQWHSKDEFIKHFEVQDKDSILQHSLKDFVENRQTNNIYYIAMNIAASFQKNPEPNKWTAFYINVIFFCVTQFFINRIAFEITGDKKKALLAVLLYGFSAGATSLTLYVRFYDLCLLSAIIISYFHIKMWETDKIWKHVLYLLGVAIAALMVYENQPYVMTYTACAVLAYLITGLVKKQKKKVIQYAGLLVIGIGASVVILNNVWKRLIMLAGGEYGRTAIENILGRNWHDYYEYMKYYIQKLLCHTLAGGKVSLCIAMLLVGVVVCTFLIRRNLLKTEYKTEYILMIGLNCILFFLIQCRLLENFEYRYMSYYYPGVCILAAVGISYVLDAIKCKGIYSYLIAGCILILQIATIYRKGYVEETYPEAAEMRQVLEGYDDCDSVLFIEARHAHQYYRDAFLIPDGTDFCAVESLQALDMNYKFLDREQGRPVLCWFPNFSWNEEDDIYKALDKIVNETEYSSYYKILETYQSMVYYLY